MSINWSPDIRTQPGKGQVPRWIAAKQLGAGVHQSAGHFVRRTAMTAGQLSQMPQRGASELSEANFLACTEVLNKKLERGARSHNYRMLAPS